MLTTSIQVDKQLLTLLTAVSHTAKAHNIVWLLVGATARGLLFEKLYGCTPGARMVIYRPAFPGLIVYNKDKRDARVAIFLRNCLGRFCRKLV